MKPIAKPLVFSSKLSFNQLVELAKDAPPPEQKDKLPIKVQLEAFFAKRKPTGNSSS